MEYLCHRAYRDIGNALQPRTPNFNVGANLGLELQSFVCHMPAEIPNPYIINIDIWGAGCSAISQVTPARSVIGCKLLSDTSSVEGLLFVLFRNRTVHVHFGFGANIIHGVVENVLFSNVVPTSAASFTLPFAALV